VENLFLASYCSQRPIAPMFIAALFIIAKIRKQHKDPSTVCAYTMEYYSVPKSLQMVATAMKIKDVCFLKEKL